MNEGLRGLSGQAWANVLREGLGASQLSIDDAGCKSIKWSVFARWGIRAAYPWFPVGIEVVAGETCHRYLRQLERLSKERVDLAMISAPVSIARGLPRAAVVAELPETRIQDIGSWSDARMKPSTRKKVHRAERAGLVVREAGKGDAERIHGLYVQSVTRKRGRLRYGLAYFRSLCDVANESPEISVGVVVLPEGECVGFIALLHDSTSSYYLHGGIASEATSARPGYLSMHWAIKRCQQRGSDSLNLLTSPVSQPGLVEFKESFGGATEIRVHCRVPLSTIGRCVDVAMRLSGRLTR